MSVTRLTSRECLLRDSVRRARNVLRFHRDACIQSAPRRPIILCGARSQTNRRQRFSVASRRTGWIDRLTTEPR